MRNEGKLLATDVRTGRRTDRRTDGRTDKVSYRGACYAPKNQKIFLKFFLQKIFGLQKKIKNKKKNPQKNITGFYKLGDFG